MDDSVLSKEGEYAVLWPTVRFFAPISLSDEEGTELYKNVYAAFTEQVTPIIEEIEKIYNVRGAMK